MSETRSWPTGSSSNPWCLVLYHTGKQDEAGSTYSSDCNLTTTRRILWYMSGICPDRSQNHFTSLQLWMFVPASQSSLGHSLPYRVFRISVQLLLTTTLGEKVVEFPFCVPTARWALECGRTALPEASLISVISRMYSTPSAMYYTADETETDSSIEWILKNEPCTLGRIDLVDLSPIITIR
jgi:hypothetical protein